MRYVFNVGSGIAVKLEFASLKYTRQAANTSKHIIVEMDTCCLEKNINKSKSTIYKKWNNAVKYDE